MFLGKRLPQLVFLLLFLIRTDAWGVPPDWQTRRFGVFTFHFREEEKRLAAYLGGLHSEIEGRVEKDLGLDQLREIQVTIASTHEDFTSLLPAGGSKEKWVAAVATPSQGRILMKSPRLLLGGQPHYERVFYHEVAHIALAQALRRTETVEKNRPRGSLIASPPLRVPRWLHEGYAIYVARQWSPSREVLLTRAVLGRRIIPLGRLVSTFPEEERFARLAYAQSADLLHYLLRTYGNEAFHGFLSELGRGHRFGHACRRAYGIDFSALERNWQRHLRRRYTWLPLLGSTGTFWFLASVILLTAYARKKLTARRKMARWEQEDPG